MGLKGPERILTSQGRGNDRKTRIYNTAEKLQGLAISISPSLTKAVLTPAGPQSNP